MKQYPFPQNLDVRNFSLAEELHFLFSINISVTLMSLFSIWSYYYILLDKMFQMGFRCLFIAFSDLTSVRDFIAR